MILTRVNIDTSGASGRFCQQEFEGEFEKKSQGCKRRRDQRFSPGVCHPWTPGRPNGVRSCVNDPIPFPFQATELESKVSGCILTPVQDILRSLEGDDMLAMECSTDI